MIRNDTPFPEKGLAAEDVMGRIEALRGRGPNWRGGRVPIFVFHANDAVEEISRAAFNAFFSENAQGVSAFPAIAEMADEVVSSGLALLRAPLGAAGHFTSGGTESIFLAVLAARERYRIRGGLAARPVIVMPRSAHPAFDKAAFYLGLDVQRIPLAPDFSADVAAMADAVNDTTAMIVGSAPSFPHGVFDSLQQLNAIAREGDVWLHVDACVGGYLAPFVRRLGRAVPIFDFGLDGVLSISADLHKYGYAAKPASTVFFRDAELASLTHFEFDDWPRGLYRSGGFPGSRPAGAIASAWAVQRYLGMDGYTRLAGEVMELCDKLLAGISAQEGLAVQGAPALSLLSYGSDMHDIQLIGDRLEQAGWVVPRNASPPGLQFMVMPVHAQSIDQYLDDLREAITQTRGQSRRRSGRIVY